MLQRLDRILKDRDIRSFIYNFQTIIINKKQLKSLCKEVKRFYYHIVYA